MKHFDAKIQRRIEAIKRKIGCFDLICSGTLLERTKTCGKPNCRCASDPDARHGPYYEWNRWEEGKLRHRLVSADQAKKISKAMDNYQRILELFARWEEETIKSLFGAIRLKKRKKGT